MKNNILVLIFMFMLSLPLLSQKQTLTKNVLYFMEGTVANSPVTMRIIIDENGKKVEGYYFYDKVGKNIGLKGVIKGGNLSLAESVDEKNTGSFNGKFDEKKGTFIGKWKNESVDKQYDFSILFTNKKVNKAYIYTYMYNETKKFREGYEENEYTFKSQLSTTLLDNRENNPVIEKINKNINDGIYLEKDIKIIFKNYINEYINEWNESGYNYSIEYSVGISHIDEKIISFNYGGYIYAGGAHGNGFLQNKIYNLQTGDDITDVSNLIKNVDDPKLLALMRIKLTKDEMVKDDYFNFDKIRLNDNYYITKDGISFLYNQYEIAAYAYGPIEIEFTYRELAPFIKDESPFKYLFDK